MNLLNKFRDHISTQNLFQAKDKLLIAVSGGVDSVVLCHLCKQSGFEFSIAHCNFQLRGEDSDRDELFVQALAKKYGVAYYSVKFDTSRIAEERKISIQEAARELRYTWFEVIRLAGGYKNILTAHHADDNMETVVMNFFRGTGIKGLKGIEPKQGHLVRPLLFARRQEVEEYLKENNLQFVQDSSNEKDDYTRNYFRHQVIPLVVKSFPAVEENMIANISRMREIEQLYQQAIEFHRKKLLEQKGNEWHIPVLKALKTTPLPSVLYELLKPFGFSAQQTSDVIDLLNSDTGKYVQSSTHRVIRNRQWLIIAPNESKDADTILVEASEDVVRNATFKFQFSILHSENWRPGNGSYTAMLDASEIKFPLLLRRWKQGDYFYPLGMKKKKKLARFFIDQKLSKTEKEKVWVIEMNKKIIWVVGHRIDERFKVTDKTKSVLKISATVQTG